MPPTPPAADRPRRLPTAAILFAVAAGLHAAALANATPLQSANDRSRWATVWSLVERGTFAIDAIDANPAWSTIDKVRHEGKLHSTKPAFLALIAAEIYRGVKAVTGWSIYRDTAGVSRLVLLVLNLLPFLLALAAVADIGRKYARTEYGRLYLLAAAAFGTYLSTFSVTLNNHTVAAVWLVYALFFALRIVADGSRRWWDYALCGFTAAVVPANELPAAAFGLALFALLMWKGDRLRTLLLFVPAALVPTGFYLWTTYLQTGTFQPFYAAYGTEKYVYIRDGLPSYWADPKGLDRNLDSPVAYFLHCTVGHHGILSLSPIFVLTLVGWARLRRRDPDAEPYRPLLWMGLGLTAVVLGFYMSRTSNYNYGGNTAGLRWAFWLIPFWLLGLLPAVDAYGDRRWFRGLAAACLGVSVFSAWSAIDNPWQPAWLYRVMESAGLIDYREPSPTLPRRQTTWFASLPPAEADPAREWIELSAPTDEGAETLRLELVVADAARPQVRLTRSLVIGGRRQAIEAATATIDRAAFDSGADVAAFVVAGEPSKAAAVRTFRRLPAAAAYRPGHVRYEKSRLPQRELAFQAQHVTATADARAGGRVFRHRLDAWLCPEVPFGVVRLRATLTDAMTGEIESRREYAAAAAGRVDPAAWAETLPIGP